MLYSFRGSPYGGCRPNGGLIERKDGATLYGTTFYGGNHDLGTIFYYYFKSQRAFMIHHFKGGPDGSHPLSPLLDVNGALYGTTSEGGATAIGTIYTTSPGGDYRVVDNFWGRPGGNPEGRLINVEGTLYGTAQRHGAFDGGTVYSLSTTAGKLEHVHWFGYRYDGSVPLGGVTDINGDLYGATRFGGVYDDGTLYVILPHKRTEQLLHSFGSGSDGRWPSGGLLNVNGTLYGTTELGGAHDAGTVYRVVKGKEEVLHSFGSGSDGQIPVDAGLIEMNGTLYGTTGAGGAYDEGTVYSISTDGMEKVLYSFGSGSDGRSPSGSLLNVNGTLYGTTHRGGVDDCGTIFSLIP